MTTKTKLKVFFTLSVALLSWQTTTAQNRVIIARPTPPPVVSDNPKLSAALAKRLEQQNTKATREQREMAYAKLLEGQRYFWNVLRSRSQIVAGNGSRLAGQSFLKAVELDPNLSEGYTALAELALTVPPQDIEEAIALASIAVKISPDNFGARRILARVYTIKSQLKPEKNGAFDSVSAAKAVREWKEVARLDSRNAEAWAFLSEFYNRANQTPERIAALRNWLSSAAPIETRYYRTIMGAQETLSPETASLKLGAALVKANRSAEAIEILSRAVAEDAENAEAIDLLRQAIDGGAASGASLPATLEALQQAVFANPSNLVLVRLLAQIQARTGKTDDAVKTLKSSIAKLGESDKLSAADLQVTLGDVYAEANRVDEAVTAYETALDVKGIAKTELITDDEREFATLVFGKIIQVYKGANRINEAKAAIERARVLLGRDDIFADRQLISLMRETGGTQEALAAVRALRRQSREDYGLLRLEAQILTETGRVDEAVDLIKPLLGKGKTSSAPSLMFDDFNNYIYISSLYNQAGRGREAVQSARQAYTVAGSAEKKQIAHLTLASAQQTSGDYKSAEEILRNLLKQSPTNPIALNNLGYFLLEREQRIDEALDLIKRAVEIDPTNSSYLDSLGWAYYKLGKLGEAELYLKEAVNNDGTSATVYEHLGDVYQKQGRTELARRTWQKAIPLATGAEIGNRLKSKISNNAAK